MNFIFPTILLSNTLHSYTHLGITFHMHEKLVSFHVKYMLLQNFHVSTDSLNLTKSKFHGTAFKNA
jgi:hypothetical protein